MQPECCMPGVAWYFLHRFLARLLSYLKLSGFARKGDVNDLEKLQNGEQAEWGNFDLSGFFPTDAARTAAGGPCAEDMG
jgi:hypothetical protein